MTQQQRRTYSRKYQALQKTLERKYLPVVYGALRKQVDAMVRSQDATLMLFNEHISPVVRRLYMEAGLVGARKMRAEMRGLPLIQKRSSFGTNDELTQAIIDFLQRYILEKVVIPISNTTKQWVLREIIKGQQEGLSANEIANRLAGDEFLKFQALRIVRTETVKAVNVGVKAAMDSSPYEVQKEWISAHDNRTRHSHRRLDGQIREMSEDFLPNLSQPGDPRADASLVINCRCTLATVAKRDENGRLLVKNPQFLQSA